MSVAPHAGIVDFGTFTSPTAGQDGIQGEVPQPLAGQQDYVLTASGWVPLSSLGTLIYQGTWDASTNTPTLTSGVGTQGYYYVVSVAGNTDLNGITTWTVGDWALFNGSVWQKIEGGSTVDITGGQINNTVIGNNVPAAGTFTTLTATGQTSLGGAAGSEGLRVTTTASANRYLIASGSNGGSPSFGASAGPLVLYGGSGQGIAFYSNAYAQAQFNIAHTASAVNYVQVTGAATGNPAVVSAQGSDTNIPLAMNAKGTSAIRLGANNTDYVAINTATAGLGIIQTLGGSTNIDLQFLPKGTGVVQFGAYTASILTPTGYITIKDSGGTTRRLLVG